MSFPRRKIFLIVKISGASVMLFLSGAWFRSAFFVEENFLSAVRETNGSSYSQGYAGDFVYASAYEQAGEVRRTGAHSGVTAHHLLVADKIAEVFESLGTGRERTIVLLSPNHFSLGVSALQTTEGTWSTLYGEVTTDQEAIEKLQHRVPTLHMEERTFDREHGVNTLTPFVRRSFPNARLVPLVIHDSASTQELSDLAHALAEELPDAIVVASIDMSHNLPASIQTYHDAVTQKVIESGGCEGKCAYDLEADANGVLRVLFELNRLRGTQHWVQTHHGSSLSMGATEDWRENTSHILGIFQEGEAASFPFASLHFAGDVMLDRGVRRKIEASDPSYPWLEMTRYLQGSQLRIANLEGTVSEIPSLYSVEPPFVFAFDPTFVEAMEPFIDVVSLANNHSEDRGIDGEAETRAWLDEIGIQWFGGSASPEPVYEATLNGMELTLVGYHEFLTPLEEVLPLIQSAHDRGRFVIVLPHWGVEYIATPQEHQRLMAQAMIRAGADLIVGTHPHVVQGVEIVEDIPVFYSLGNFVFDQTLPETFIGMTLGVLLQNGSATLYLSPLGTQGGQPVPLSDEETQTFLKNIARISSPELLESVQKGIITHHYD